MSAEAVEFDHKRELAVLAENNELEARLPEPVPPRV